MRGRGDLSVFRPCMESALSPRDLPGGQGKRPSQRSFSCKNLRDTPRELPDVLDALVCARKKRTPSGFKGLLFLMNSSFSYTDQRRGQWPYLTQLFLTQIRRWQTFLDVITWMRVSQLLSSCSCSSFTITLEIMTGPSSRIIVKTEMTAIIYLCLSPSKSQ